MIEIEPNQTRYLIFDKSLHKTGERLRRFSLPGFERVPCYYVIKFFYSGLLQGSLTTRAAAIAFNFLLAIGPAIIFLLTLLPYFPLNVNNQEFISLLKDIMPNNAYIFLESTFNELSIKRGGLQFFGFITALFFATKGISSMIGAFNASFHDLNTRSFTKKVLISILLVCILALLVLTSAFIFISGKIWIENIIKSEILIWTLIISRWVFMYFLLFLGISFLYYLAPERKSEWRFISPGSTFASILALLTSLGFSYFVNNFAQFNKIFGSIGALIALMLWLNFIAFALLIGFELNASIHNAKANNYTFGNLFQN